MITVRFPVFLVRACRQAHESLPAAASDEYVVPCGWKLVALKSTILYHDPHDLLKKGVVFQGLLCVLDSEQPGDGPKVELCSLSDKI
jgi:hypothetical protein